MLKPNKGTCKKTCSCKRPSLEVSFSIRLFGTKESKQEIHIVERSIVGLSFLEGAPFLVDLKENTVLGFP